MASTLKLPYGLQGNQLLHIKDVPNGLACACVCPGCGARLVARNQGKVKTAHFAHYQAPECATGLQTALHLAAKEVFLQQQTFRLPGAAGIIGFHAEHFDKQAYFGSFAYDAASYQHAVENRLDLDCEYAFEARYVKINQVLLEHRTGDIIPDIILETEAGPLLVEVAVTHFIDEAKQEKIKRLGISTVEIDLSKASRELSSDALTDLLIHQTDRKRWAYNARLDAKVAARHAHYLEAARPLFAAWHTKLLHEQQEEERERQRQQQRKEFYATQIKPITFKGKRYGTARQVLGCPDPRRSFDGQLYSNVDADCLRCAHFRGYGAERKSVICLYEYTNRHKIPGYESYK